MKTSNELNLFIDLMFEFEWEARRIETRFIYFCQTLKRTASFQKKINLKSHKYFCIHSVHGAGHDAPVFV